jgi:YHS domain-containing protein
MKRIAALALALGLLGLAAPSVAAPTAKEAAAKKALQELHEFVGGWKGSAGKTLILPKGAPFWEEQVDWGWKFKGDTCWMVMGFKGGKFLSKAELKYDADKKKFLLIGTPTKGSGEITFTGTFSDDKLTFERTDPDTKDTQRIRINTAAEGIRLIYQVDRKAEGGTLWKPEFAMQATKLGESLAKTEKGPECVVSGGRGTSSVSYMGETFYICCSGCADAFKENPKKYVDEFKAKKKKK